MLYQSPSFQEARKLSYILPQTLIGSVYHLVLVTTLGGRPRCFASNNRKKLSSSTFEVNEFTVKQEERVAIY